MALAYFFPKARLIRRISAVSNSMKRIEFDGNLTSELAAAFLARSTGLVALSDRNATSIQTSNTNAYVSYIIQTFC